MRTEVDKYLWDAREAAARTARFVADKNLADYTADELLRAAVERQLTIVGEALSRLRQLDPGLAGRIRGLNQAVALRNLLVHAYAEIDDEIVWGAVTEHLPGLVESIRAL